MAMTARGADAYRQTQAQSSSPLELVVMLYDGAIRFLREAREAAAKHDIAGRGTAISRTLAILAELQGTLNLAEGGDVARELDRLYSYMTRRLLDVATKGDINAATEVQKLLTTLRDSWSQIAAQGVGVVR